MNTNVNADLWQELATPIIDIGSETDNMLRADNSMDTVFQKNEFWDSSYGYGFWGNFDGLVGNSMAIQSGAQWGKFYRSQYTMNLALMYDLNSRFTSSPPNVIGRGLCGADTTYYEPGSSVHSLYSGIYGYGGIRPITNWNFSKCVALPIFTLWDGKSFDSEGYPTNTESVYARECINRKDAYVTEISYRIYYGEEGERRTSPSIEPWLLADGASSGDTIIDFTYGTTNGPVCLTPLTKIITCVTWRGSEAPVGDLPNVDIKNYPGGIYENPSCMVSFFNNAYEDAGAFEASGPYKRLSYLEDGEHIYNVNALKAEFAPNVAAMIGLYCADDIGSIQDPITSPHIFVNMRSASGQILPITIVNEEDKANDPWLYEGGAPRGGSTGYNSSDITPVDHNTYTDEMEPGRPSVTPYGAFSRFFAMTKSEVNEFADEIFTADESKAAEISKGLILMGTNPIQSVISMRMYPFNVKAYTTTARAHISMGRTQLETETSRIVGNPSIILDLGRYDVVRKFNNYLDYEETKLSIYLPYIGTFSLDPKQCMGKSLHVTYTVDLFTGTCEAFVTANGIMVLTQQGVIGINMATTGSDASGYASQAYNATFNQVNAYNQAITGTARSIIGVATSTSGVGALTGGIAGTSGALSGSMGIDKANLDKKLSTNASSPIVNGTASPMLAMYKPQVVYLIFDYPVLENPSLYGESEGYTYMKSGRLSQFSGHTRASNPHLNGLEYITREELESLTSILEGGIDI